MARVFAETPWLMLPFLFVVLSYATYVGNLVKLVAGLLLVEVVALNIFYLVEFAPGEVGWFASEAFSGGAIAIGLLVLFDNWLWPERGETLLMESLGNSLGRVCSRLVWASALLPRSRGRGPAAGAAADDRPTRTYGAAQPSRPARP
jgi:hypothetical protein